MAVDNSLAPSDFIFKIGGSLPIQTQVPTFVNDYSSTDLAWVEPRAVGDLNLDGLDDLVYAFHDSYSPPLILLSNGDGTFDLSASIQGSATRHHLRKIVIEDVNLDGLPDLAGFETGHLMSDQKDLLLLNEGNGQFRQIDLPVIETAGHHGGDVGDVNNDGLPDLLGVAEFPTRMADDPRVPYIQSGEESFTKGLSKLPAAFNNYGIADLDIDDIDGDGYQDVLLALNWQSQAKQGREFTYEAVKGTPVAAIIWGDSGDLAQRATTFFGDHWMDRENFEAFSAYYGDLVDDAYAGGINIKALDLHGSGKKEVIVNSIWAGAGGQVGSGFEAFAVVGRNLIDKTDDWFPNRSASEEPSTSFSFYFDNPDLNNDGLKDLLISSKDTPVLSSDGHSQFYLRQTDGTFLPIKASQTFYGPLAGDFNGDGLTDFASINGDKVQAFLGTKGTAFPSNLKYGTVGSDEIRLGEGEVAFGLSGDDSFLGSTEGPLQSVVYSGVRANFNILNSPSAVTISDQKGQQGSDTLMNVERAVFSDAVVAFDTLGESSAGAGYRLYKAAFDRTPDEEGLGYWINELDQGFALHQVANSFVISQEFKNLYGADLNNEGFITALYNNVLDRDPDQGGLDYWVNDMESNGMSRADVLASFSESAENIANTDPLIELGVVYQPYGDVLLG